MATDDHRRRQRRPLPRSGSPCPSAACATTCARSASSGSRELIRFRSDRLRDRHLADAAAAVPVRPGHRPVLAGRAAPPAGVDFKTFIYPGVLAMSVLFTAIFSAGSIVWDREFGFLREMLVAPVSRAADRDRQVPRRRHHRDDAGHHHPRAGRRWSACPTTRR